MAFFRNFLRLFREKWAFRVGRFEFSVSLRLRNRHFCEKSNFFLTFKFLAFRSQLILASTIFSQTPFSSKGTYVDRLLWHDASPRDQTGAEFWAYARFESHDDVWNQWEWAFGSDATTTSPSDGTLWTTTVLQRRIQPTRLLRLAKGSNGHCIVFRSKMGWGEIGNLFFFINFSIFNKQIDFWDFFKKWLGPFVDTWSVFLTLQILGPRRLNHAVLWRNELQKVQQPYQASHERVYGLVAMGTSEDLRASARYA